MRLVVKHVRKTKAGNWQYRRQVAEPLRPIVGKREIKQLLGATEAEALKHYAKFHPKAEAVLSAAWNELNGVQVPEMTHSARELFDHATKEMRALGFNPYAGEGDGGPDDISWIARSVVADQIATKYPTDPDTDYPLGVSPADVALITALHTSTPREAPPPTLEDAKRLYLKDRFAKRNPSPYARKKDEQQAERVVGHVKSALGYDPVLATMKRADARDVANAMLEAIPTAETVDRYLNVIQAIINYGIREFDLSGVKNQFEKLGVLNSSGEPEKRKKLPFSPEQLDATRNRIFAHAADDLKLIWRLLQGTGCRLSEITGLRVSDVALEALYPHIDVEWHEERRVKTQVSRRKVPLIGDALQAATEAVKAADNSKMLFARYGHEGGGDKASAALGKHVRAVVSARKVTTHSLRHRMEDLLVIAWAPDKLKRSIMGHSGGGSADNYGGEEARLKVATEVMLKALGPQSSDQSASPKLTETSPLDALLA